MAHFLALQGGKAHEGGEMRLHGEDDFALPAGKGGQNFRHAAVALSLIHI